MTPRPRGPGPETAGVIAPPPLIAAVGLALGIALDAAVAPGGFGVAPALRGALAGGLLAAGAVAIAAAAGRFVRAGTAIVPTRPSTALVTHGIYRTTRNPIYLGLLAVVAAVCLALDRPLALLALVPVTAVLRYGVIAREERYLAARFGASYLAYCARVPRWL